MGYRTTVLLFIFFNALIGSSQAFESGCSGETPSKKEVSGIGQMVYVDPDTGELLSGPPNGEALQAPAAAAQTAAPIEIQQQVQSDGSVVADIGDHFNTELRVEIVDGKAVTCHRSTATTHQPDPIGESQTERKSDNGR